MDQIYTVIITSDNGHILRNTTVTSLDEVTSIHKKLPNNLLGLFEGTGDEKDATMWLWVPEWEPSHIGW